MQDLLLTYVSMFISTEQLNNWNNIKKTQLYLENITEALSHHQYKHYMDIKTAHACVTVSNLDLQINHCCCFGRGAWVLFCQSAGKITEHLQNNLTISYPAVLKDNKDGNFKI